MDIVPLLLARYLRATCARSKALGIQVATHSLHEPLRGHVAAGVRQRRSRREVAVAVAEGRPVLQSAMPAARNSLERPPLFR